MSGATWHDHTKVHLLDESYAWVPKSRDFVEDLIKEFGKSKV